TTRQVTDLGLKYTLLTKHTSFIAVLEQIRNPAGNAANADQPLPLPLGVSELAVASEYESGAEPELPWLVALLLAVLALIAYRKRMLRSARLP
ncbi:MAG: trypsin, partial [Polyangiales bacterium]